MKLGRIVVIISMFLVYSKPVHAAEVRVAVALSLQDAFEDLAVGFEQKNKGIKILYNYGSSQALARQIASGARVDLYISAHKQWVDYLVMGRHIDDLLINTFASNSLVFIGLPSKKYSSLQDIRLLRRIAVGNPLTTAHGQYTLEAIRNAGLEPELKNRIVMGNAIENISRVEKGEVDGAILYRTETVHMKKAKILFTVLQSLHPPITYQVSVAKLSVNDPAVLGFYKYLTGADAKPILMRHGFGTR